MGADFAGRVEAVGKEVNDFQPGDEVFGTSGGSWAEYAASPATKLAPKPANVSFEEAAAVPVAALTALQALRDKGEVQPGQKVLINGASGGVGTYAVQIAKVFGADVTAVCSTGNVEQARSLGADRVVDYTQEDFTKLGERHDLMLDIAGSRSFLAFRRVLTPEATVALIGGPMTYRGLGPLPHLAGTMLKSRGRSQKVKFFVAKINTADLVVMDELLEAGKVRSVIDREYPLSEAPAALAYLGEGHARGKSSSPCESGEALGAHCRSGTEDGAEGARTPGLRHAMAALFQLSYGPLSPNCSREIEVVRPVDPPPLVVATRGDAKRDRRSVLHAVQSGSESTDRGRGCTRRSRRPPQPCTGGV